MSNAFNIKYSYDGLPTLRDFAMSDARIRGIKGPFGSGKSSASVVELVRRAQMHPRSPDGIRHSRWGVVRNTYSELRSTTIKTVFQWMPPVYFGKYVEQKHTYSVKAFPGVDMEILFLALDRPDDVSKLLSLELTGGWVNEAREVPWAVIEALDGRIARYPQRQDVGNYWSGIWMDTNPPDTDSAWYRFFEEKRWVKDFEKLKREGALPPDMRPEQYAAIFSQPSGTASNAENLPNLEPGYYQKLGIGKSDEWKKIYIHGQYGFLLEGKLVYPEYADKIHCVAVDPIPGVTIIRSWDWGLTPSCVFSQMLPDGRWLVFDEMTSDNMSVDQFSDEVIEHCKRAFRGNDVRFEDWGDPAGTQRAQTDKKTCFEIVEAKGIEIEGSIQDPTLRQESVRKTLRTLVAGEPQFILHPRCKMLRKGFMGGYHRRRMQTAGPERYAADAEKNIFSHCMPAGVLIDTPAGAVPIETIRVGDLVGTPTGPRHVMATMNREAVGIGTIFTGSGRQLPCTPCHPIYHDGVFSRADALQYGDMLQGSTPWADQPSIRSRSSTASGTIESPAATTRPTTPSAASTCTVRSGDIITAKSQKASSFITSTMTVPTTLLRTWPTWARALTRLCTALNAQRTIPRAPGSTWPISGQKPAIGTALKMAVHGIVNTALEWLLRCQLSATPASAAGVDTTSSVVVGRSAIAPMLVRRLLDERAVSTTNSAGAQSAPRRSSPTAIQRFKHADRFVAADWQPDAVSTVYDLTVEEAGCFYANGLLVGNCHDALQYAIVQYFGPSLTVQDAVEDDFGPQHDYAVDASRDETTGY